MDLKNLKEMWDKLKSICTKVGQGIVYSILQELLHYPNITKLKKYKMLVIQILVEVKYLCKCFLIAIISRQDF